MKLKLGCVQINDIQFASESKAGSGITYANAEELKTFSLEDRNPKSAEPEITKLGKSVRIMLVKDMIESRVKVSEGGNLFPGVISKVETVGSGRTNVLKGSAVITTGRIVGFQEGTIDMCGEGAKYISFSQLNNLAVVCEPIDGFVKHAHEKAVRFTGPEAADYIGRLVKGVKSNEVKIYETCSVKGGIKKYLKLPRAACTLMLRNQGLIHNTYVHGVDMRQFLSIVLSLTELMDGAILGGNCVSACDKNTTYHHLNNLIIADLLERHRRTLNFVDVTIANENVYLADRMCSSDWTSKPCGFLGVDGATISQGGFGNPDTGLTINCRETEAEGVKIIIITDEYAGRDGASQSLTDAGASANAVVTSENANMVINLSAMDKVIGYPEATDITTGGFDRSLQKNGPAVAKLRVITGATSEMGFNRLSVRQEDKMPELRIVHYINRFFANIGGEEKADCQPELRGGIVGLGMALNQAFGEEAEIVATVIYGNSYFSEDAETVKKTILDMVNSQKPDAATHGPASNAGRYGVACGTVALTVKERLNLPVLTGMYKENPGADVYKTKVYVVEIKNSAAGMKGIVATMAPLALKLAKDEKLGFSKEEGYMPNSIRVSLFEDKRGSQRAVEMLIKKLSGKEFTTELPMSNLDRVDPSPAAKDMVHAKITLVASGGTVPKGNPDHIEPSNASKYGKYDIDGVTDLTEATYETAHGGYDLVCVSEDANRVLPIDILREFGKEGKTGGLRRCSYTTVGNGISVTNPEGFVTEFAQELRNDGVDAVIPASTWGTRTCCGATTVKEVERAGVPVVRIAIVVPILLTVRANRVVPAITIPHPPGNSALIMEEKKETRRHILTETLTVLETPVTEQTVFE